MMLTSMQQQSAQSIARLATDLKPNEGKTLSFLGYTFTCKSDSSSEGWRFFEVIGLAGNPTPLHSHPWDEGFYVLEGAIDFQIDDQIVSASPGYCVQIPAGTAHGSHIRSPQVKLLNWVSDSRAEQYVMEMAQIVQPNAEAIAAIRQRYGVLFVETMQPASRPASVFAPNQGKVFSVLGDTITCKSSSIDTQGWRFFELVGCGNGGPRHTHPWDAGLYVLEGEIEVQLGDRTVIATPGYFINIPAGMVHTYQIQSPQARFVGWFPDTRAEQCFAELDQTTQVGSEQANDIRQKHQIVPTAVVS